MSLFGTTSAMSTTTSFNTTTSSSSSSFSIFTSSSSSSSGISTSSSSSASSTTTSPISISSTSTNPVFEGLDRRRLVTELNLFGTLIRNSRLDDPLTNALAIWQRDFTTALQKHRDADEVFFRFSGELQRMIGNTFADASLDERFNFGNQRETYQELQRVLTRLKLIPRQQARPPLPPSDEERINRIYARAAQTNVREARGLVEQRHLHRNQLGERITAMRGVVSSRVRGLRTRIQEVENRGMEQIARFREGEGAQFQAMQNWIDESGQRDRQALAAIETLSTESAAQQRESWEQSRQALDRVRAEDREELGRIDLFLRNSLSEIFAPFAQEIREFAQQETAVIQQMNRDNQDAGLQTQARLHGLNQEMAVLTQGNLELQVSRERVNAALAATIEQERILERCSRETEQAVNNMEKGQKSSFNPLGMIAIAIVLTCGGQYMLASSGSSAGVTVSPLNGGGGFVRFVVPFP